MTAAAGWRAFGAQARVELLLTARRYENLLVTLAVPLILLVFLAAVPLAPQISGARRIDVLVPRVLAVALIGTGLVSLGIATAYERSYGVLKRLVGSPLPPWALLASKTLAVLATVGAQLLLVAMVGTLLGWSPPGGPVAALLRALPWVALGTVTFAALGLLLAGTLRPEAVLAAANGLFLVCILLGGVVVPAAQLPPPVASVAALLPPALLADLLTVAIGTADSTAPLSSSLAAVHAGALLGWAIALAAAAVATFRVD